MINIINNQTGLIPKQMRKTMDYESFEINTQLEQIRDQLDRLEKKIDGKLTNKYLNHLVKNIKIQNNPLEEAI
jgi:predicted mannosyl-3-phosphoglycerate phosphatase (HAD superfamily)